MKRIAGHDWKTAATLASRYGKLAPTHFLYLCFFVAYEGVLRFVAGERPLFGILPTTGPNSEY